MDIGEAIRTLRLKQGMTQGQLAEKCFVSINAVSSWETGKTYPPKGATERICKAMGIPTAYLFLASIGEEDVPEEKRMLYKALVEPLRKELLDNGTL
jgi:transcriptional regulator with XRE-family HTH domain